MANALREHERQRLADLVDVSLPSFVFLRIPRGSQRCLADSVRFARFGEHAVRQIAFSELHNHVEANDIVAGLAENAVAVDADDVSMAQTGEDLDFLHGFFENGAVEHGTLHRHVLVIVHSVRLPK